jgi:Spy/CpxP family protein refolding chaperone
MNTIRFAKSIAISAGLMFLSATPWSVRADSAAPRAMQTPAPASRGAQPTTNSALNDDFAGLDYSDEQKAEIAKIHSESERRKGMVAKDDKLTPDQKDAMLLGYTRLEYGEIFKVLTPIQKRLVRSRMQARREADQATHKKQLPPHPQN